MMARSGAGRRVARARRPCDIRSSRRGRPEEVTPRVRPPPQHVGLRDAGLPSNSSGTRPSSSPTRKFHTIHPVVEKKNPRSAGPQVDVQLQLELFQQDAAVPVDDRLGQAGGAGRVQDPQRVLERHLLIAEVGSRDRGWSRVADPGHRPRDPAAAGPVQVGHVDDVCRLSGVALAELAGAGTSTSRRSVAVRGDQHPGGHWRNRSITPRRRSPASSRTRSRRRWRWRASRRLPAGRSAGRAHAVAGPDAEVAQPGGQRGDLGGQHGPGQPGPRFARRVRSLGGRALAAQQVLRLVQPGAGEPPAPGCARWPAPRWAARRPGRRSPRSPARTRRGRRRTSSHSSVVAGETQAALPG